MVNENKFINFNASVVPLQGINLIEASAGTGKTYSIAILVLRLILEQRFSIKEILMVTFTKAAVAELEERIRLFIRSAYSVSNNEVIEDSTITTLVNDAIKNNSQEEVQFLLKDAVVFLDETAVLTIHSFCQQTLAEFAFETNQLFGAELLLNTTDMLEDEVNKFWRKHITSIPVELLSFLEKKLNRADLNSIVKDHLNGKRFYEYQPGVNDVLPENFYQQITDQISNLSDAFSHKQAEIVKYIIDHNEPLKIKSTADSNARKWTLHLIDHPQEFINTITEKRTAKYIEKLYGDILFQVAEGEIISKEKEACIEKCLNQIYYMAITAIAEGVKNDKLHNNQVSFDDLIANLHTALVAKDNPQLVAALQNKYKAVFIDEFQDTDKLQYEVFKKAFGTNTILFYIGDPKQSIYAWRKADISTYFKAYDDVNYKYGMNENYRSSAQFIQAMNVFFEPEPGFDTFHFSGADQAITYIPVNSPASNSKGKLNYQGNTAIPISINSLPKKEAIEYTITAQVIELLSGENYTVVKNEVARQIKPSDIGILVRNNKEGMSIKNRLARYGIPAVTIGDAKVLASETATEILYVLEAMMDISRSNINRALLASFTGYTVQHILSLQDDTAIDLFKKYKTNWDTDGIYTALMNFIADFGIQQVLLQKNTEYGERIITNLYQLVELLYKIQTTKKLSPLELTDWLKRGIENNDAEGDEYEQRIENDEESVKIVTIHKSKGLEYNIVLAPFLDFVERKNEVFCSYRNPAGEYINLKKDHLSDADKIIYQQQTEQENRRLLYVAITRAVYKCFLYRNLYYRESTLNFFTKALTNADNSLIEQQQPPVIEEGYFYAIAQQPKIIPAPKQVQFNLLQKNWGRLSYTMLAADIEKQPKLKREQQQNDYDHFIFNQLEKGNKTGNLLHYIFETLHFANTEKWTTVIDTAIKRFSPAQKTIYAPLLPQLVQQVLHAKIKVDKNDFTLAAVNYDQRIHEFEFDFPVTVFQSNELEKIATQKLTLQVKKRFDLEGIMNGKIDMFFEHGGKYFVLDWKSTFLGDRITDYEAPALQEAMNENNYHLQYLIYTLAAKKYLESRLPQFDYETDFGGVLYLFIRGMRENADSGIFYTKPTLQQVELLDEVLCGR